MAYNYSIYKPSVNMSEEEEKELQDNIIGGPEMDHYRQEMYIDMAEKDYFERSLSFDEIIRIYGVDTAVAVLERKIETLKEKK